MHEYMNKPFIVGYRQASQLTGIPEKRLRRMAWNRLIRVIRPNPCAVLFDEDELWEDIKAMTQEKRK